MIAAARYVSRHFTVFACLAYLVAWVERIGEAVLTDGPLHMLRSGAMTQYFVNYPDHGFARRALIGTILRPLTQGLDAPEPVIFWLMVLLNIAGFVTVILLANRLLPHDELATMPVFLRAGLAIGSVGVMQIAHDYGRFDILNYIVLAGALWLVLRGRVVAAALVCGAGILIHEGFAIYAAPLVIGNYSPPLVDIVGF